MPPKRKRHTQLEKRVCAAPASKPAVRFLDLPLELRTMIYELAFMDDPRQRYHGQITSIHLSNVQTPALAHVSSQIRTEALSVFFSRMAFYVTLLTSEEGLVELSENAKAWLESGSLAPYVAQLRTLVVHLPSHDSVLARIMVQMNPDYTVSVKRESFWPGVGHTRVAMDEERKMIQALPRNFQQKSQEYQNTFPPIVFFLQKLQTHLETSLITLQCQTGLMRAKNEDWTLQRAEAERLGAAKT